MESSVGPEVTHSVGRVRPRAVETATGRLLLRFLLRIVTGRLDLIP
jgi:hypothetical protein